jgi:hypothetical protein
LEVYGQRELAELARDKQKLTALLRRYLPDADQYERTSAELGNKLERSRQVILQAEADLRDLDERIGRLPALEERLRRFEKAGVAERLAEQARLQTEEQLLDRAAGVAASIARLPVTIRESISVDIDFLDDPEATELPHAGLLAEAKTVLANLSTAIEKAAAVIERAAGQAKEDLSSLRGRWSEESRAVREQTDLILRELQPEGFDGAEYLRLRSRVNELKPLVGQREEKKQELERMRQERQGLLVEKEGLCTTLTRSQVGCKKGWSPTSGCSASYGER